MKILVFFDLDDTLFQTAPKCPPGEPVQPIYFSPKGEPISFMTANQQQLFTWISQASVLVPTTGRDQRAFFGVQLPFSELAIINHGATILRQSKLDSHWHEHMLTQIQEIRLEMETLEHKTHTFVQQEKLGAHVFPINDLNERWYLVAKHPQRDLSQLETLKQFWKEQIKGLENRFYIIANGNNLALLPRAISKRAAVEYVLSQKRIEGPWLTLGIGDSISDLGFMDLCDVWMTPRNSQISAIFKESYPGQ